MQTLKHFLNMGGYGFYVWSAYGSTCLLLAAQWMLAWRRASKCEPNQEKQ